MVRYGPLAQVVEHLTFNQVVRGSSPRWLTNPLGLEKVLVKISGPVVKRLRHRPFTAETWVRFPSGSPKCHFSSVGRATDLWDR